jgi:hypothetical protein
VSEPMLTIHNHEQWIFTFNRATRKASLRAGTRPPASTLLDAGDTTEWQLRDFPREDFMVEGKGFEPSTSALRTPRSPN